MARQAPGTAHTASIPESRRCRCASRSLSLSLSLWVVCACVAPLHAQGGGSWSDGFDHATTGPAALNDYLSPFSGQPGYVAPPSSGWWSWGYYFEREGKYQPVHMALIPKGPHQGKVLIWDEWPVILNPGTNLDPQDRFWYCQTWSIVDPSDPSDPKFLNYLLPLGPASLPGGNVDQTQVEIESLICAGHAWSQHGDLVVAGGTRATIDAVAYPPGYPTSVINAEAPKFLFLFDPARASQQFPGQLSTTSLYAAHVGWWQAAPPTDELLVGRWYPTVTLSQVLSRINPPTGGEVVIVSGGNDFLTGEALNTYESYVVRRSNDPLPFLSRDPDHTIAPATSPHPLPGPIVTSSEPRDQLLGEYARLHVLSNGDTFLSGYAKRSAAINLDEPLAQPRTWDQGVGQNATSWNDWRRDGASVFFGRVDTLQDVVVRLGGQGVSGAPTDTVEFCLATTGTADWTELPVIPPSTPQTPMPRQDLNAVILPDASVLVIGGSSNNAGNSPVTDTVRWRMGIGWETLAPSPAWRMYHSTAVLLPSGKVLVGGGDDRVQHPSMPNHDFHVFSPPYVTDADDEPVIVGILDSTGAPVPQDPGDGTFRLQGHQPPAAAPTFRLDCTVQPLDSVTKVVLMAPGSITHHSDMTARYVELPSASIPGSPGSRTFLTLDSMKLPRGYYMLFALNAADLPSEAVWVQIR